MRAMRLVRTLGWRATFYVIGMEHSATSAQHRFGSRRRGVQCSARRSSLCERVRREVAVHFLFPHIPGSFAANSCLLGSKAGW